MSDTPADLSYQELRAAAELLARRVQTSGLAEEAIDAHRPGAGVEEDSARTWLAFFGWLNQQLGTTRRADDAPARDVGEVLTNAMDEAPDHVVLEDGTAVRVYAKSLHTLLLLEALDAECRQARADLLEELAVADDEGDRTQHARAELVEALLRSKCIRTWAWILTTPGVGLPFEEAAPEVDPPAWTKAMTVTDLAAILGAHARVNRDDIGLISHAFPSDDPKTPSKLPLSGFLGAMAQEWGTRGVVLTREWSLRGLFAQALAAAQSAREARQAADRARA